MLNFAESGHPVFRATSALERGELKSKGGGRKSIHFNGGVETVELILRTVISVNQLSIHVAVADLCQELDPDSRKQTEGEVFWDLWWYRLRFPMPTLSLRLQHRWHRGTCCKNTSRNS